MMSYNLHVQLNKLCEGKWRLLTTSRAYFMADHAYVQVIARNFTSSKMTGNGFLQT